MEAHRARQIESSILNVNLSNPVGWHLSSLRSLSAEDAQATDNVTFSYRCTVYLLILCRLAPGGLKELGDLFRSPAAWKNPSKFISEIAWMEVKSTSPHFASKLFYRLSLNLKASNFKTSRLWPKREWIRISDMIGRHLISVDFSDSTVTEDWEESMFGIKILTLWWHRRNTWVNVTFDSSMCLVPILSIFLLIEVIDLSDLVQDIVYFSINKKITDEWIKKYSWAGQLNHPSWELSNSSRYWTWILWLSAGGLA